MIRGSITISRPSYSDGKKVITIQIKDRDAVSRFLDIEIEYDKFAEVITGLSETDINFTVRNLDKVGKTREIQEITFPVNKVDYTDRKENAIEQAKEFTPKGWECDNYFGSQSSFFIKDGVEYARSMIRRWV